MTTDIVFFGVKDSFNCPPVVLLGVFFGDLNSGFAASAACFARHSTHFASCRTGAGLPK
jgi:hypothetical protein